jgi:hypothetical protein
MYKFLDGHMCLVLLGTIYLVELLGDRVTLYLVNYLRNYWTFLKWLRHFIFPPTLHEDSHFSTLSPALVII